MSIRAPASPDAVLQNAVDRTMSLGVAPAPRLETPRREARASFTRSGDAPFGASEFDLGGAAPQAYVEASHPLPVYSIPLKRLAELGVEGLSEARQQGWRVFVGDGADSRTVDVGAEDMTAKSVRTGSYGAMVAQASALAESLAAEDIDYEARILDFGRLGMSALWLHAPQADKFFTVEPIPQERSTAEYLELAAQRARDRISAYEVSGAMDATGLKHDLGG
jgi:hypothetical protein